MAGLVVAPTYADGGRQVMENRERLRQRAQARRRLFAQNPQMSSTARTQRGSIRTDASQTQGLLTSPNNMPSLLGDM